MPEQSAINAEALAGSVFDAASELASLIDGASCDGGVAELAGICRAAVSRFEGLLVLCADRAVELEDSGVGCPAEEVVSRGRGAQSCSLEDGRRLVHRAELTAALPEVGDVVRHGQAPVASVDSLCRALSQLEDDELAAFLELDCEIAERIASHSVPRFARWVHRAKRQLQQDDGEKTLQEQEDASSVTWWRTPDNRIKVLADLDVLRGEEAIAWIMARARSDQARHTDVDPRGAMSDDSLASAFFDLLKGGALTDGGMPAPNRISVIVDHQTAATGQAHDGTVCETHEGHPVPVSRLAGFACDAIMESIALGPDGEAFNFGRGKRLVQPVQRKALRAMYQKCPLSGTPFRDCEVHHLKWFDRDDGPTDMDNLVPISRRWHHKIHDEGWDLQMRPDQSLILKRPNGAIHREIGPPTPITRDHQAQPRHTGQDRQLVLQ